MAKLVTITGIKELDKALSKLEPKVVKQILRKALRPAMKPMLRDAKNRAPVLTGMTRRAIKIKSIRSRKTLGLDIQLAEQNYVGKTFYGSFVEFGTSKMEPRPFMRPAFDAGKAKAKATSITEIRKLILDQAKKK